MEGINGWSDFVLDTEGSCFLCRNQVSFHNRNPSAPDANPRQEQHEPELSSMTSQIHSLHCLSTYLKMDMRKVFSEPEGPVPPHLLEMVRRARLRAELCQDCAHLTETFSKVYRNFEKSKIEMGFYLSLIENKLVQGKEADKREERMELESSNLKENIGKSGKKKIASVLRTEAIEKCSYKIAHATPAPQIKVRNMTPNQINTKRNKMVSRSQNVSMSNSSQLTSEEHVEAPGIKLELEEAAEPADAMAIFSDDDNDNNGEGYHHFDEDNYDMTGDLGTLESNNLINTSESGATEPRMDGNNFESRVNPETGKIECSICSKPFGSIKSFSVHYNNAHLKIKYKCNLCGAEFTTRPAYSRHHRTIHLDTTKFKCDKCGKTFKRKDYFVSHQRTKRNCAENKSTIFIKMDTSTL